MNMNLLLLLTVTSDNPPASLGIENSYLEYTEIEELDLWLMVFAMLVTMSHEVITVISLIF